jgi:O-antigen/teichoic acid export membrane protein
LDKYKKLAANTVIVGIGSFSSKLLVFLMVPITTRLLSTSEFGSADLAVQAANVLYPIVSFGIANAIMRFGLDKNEDKTNVFSTGIFASILGFALMLLFTPLFYHVGSISKNVVSIFLYVFFATIHAICSSFVRACEKIRLYAADGILGTVLTILFTLLFLKLWHMGVAGYLLATTAANAVSIIFLTIRAELYKFLRFRGFNRQTSYRMLKYSVPLIPSMIFWWITSVSDRFLVTHFLGSAANGLYALSNKAPQVITIISGIFSDAWLISAVSQEEDRWRDHFFSKVFRSYQAIAFITASGLIMCAQLVTRLLAAPAFFESWRYMPVLIVATVFSCFVTFLQSIYFVEKKSVSALVTISAGAAVNILLNIFLIPVIGINGAALSTLVSYVLVFALRAVNSGKYIKLKLNIPMMSLNILILAAQAVILLMQFKWWPAYEAALFLAVGALNIKPLLMSAKRLTSR